MFYCGFFESDITPHIGSIIPGSFGARRSKGVRDRLYARAFVASKDGAHAAMVVIDTCGITKDITDRIRRRVCEYTPLMQEQILVMATHTHSGGPTLNWGEQVRRDEFYIDNLVVYASDALINAWNNKKPSVIRLGNSEMHGYSFIRVYEMKDGSLKTNPGMKNPDVVRPHGEIDPEVLVLYVEQDGKPAGAVVNFACHPAIVCGEMSSGDFISELSYEMKRLYGGEFVTLFINGACGNINHININDDDTVDPDRHAAIGRVLAGKAGEAIDSSTGFDGDIDFGDTAVNIKLRVPAPDDVAKAARTLYESGWAEGKSNPGTPGYVETFFALEALKRSAEKRLIREIYLQVLKIGGLYVCGTPCQMFVEFGRKIKNAIGRGRCMVSVFANDYCGYVPTEDCFVPGVYEARLASTSNLVPQAGDMVCDAVIKLGSVIKRKQ